jgi:hypothetical protein
LKCRRIGGAALDVIANETHEAGRLDQHPLVFNPDRMLNINPISTAMRPIDT